MKTSLIYNTDTWLLCVILMVLMMGMIWLGLKLRPKETLSSIGPIEASLFGLLGLLLAFTFSMSASRYDSRRSVLVEEANNIGTAILRADMYGDSIKRAFKNDFAAYIEARIAYHDAARDTTAVKAASDSAAKYSASLWKRTTGLSANMQYLPATQQMIPALNSMFDIVNSRDASLHAHIPDPIIILLFLLSLCCSFFVGLSAPKNNKMNWPMIIGFCVLTMLVVFTILDLDRPYRGLIKADRNEKYMKELRSMVK